MESSESSPRPEGARPDRTSWKTELDVGARAELRRLHVAAPRFALLHALGVTTVWLAASVAAFLVPWRAPRIVLALGAGVALHAMGVLLHDAVHGSLFRRPALDRLAGFLLGAPSGFAFTAYQTTHLLHHRHLGTSLDPDDFMAPYRPRRLNEFVFYTWPVLGMPFYVLQVATTAFARGTARQRVGAALEYAVIAVGAWSLVAAANHHGHGAVLAEVWLGNVLAATFVNGLRGWAEHAWTRYGDPMTQTRTLVLPRAFELALCNVNYHLEHHLFPRVPWYRLRRLHDVLEGVERRHGAFVGGSYLRCALDVFRRGTWAPPPAPVPRGTPAPAAGTHADAPRGVLVRASPAERVVARAERLTAQGLYPYQPVLAGKAGPRVRVGGRPFALLSTYDYLGLVGHPRIEAAARRAVRAHGTGTGGVRLLTGSVAVHVELERRLAAFKGTQDAVALSSGYLANLALLSAVARRRDTVVLDARAHRSIFDACATAGVVPVTFAHDDVASLRAVLEARPDRQRTVVWVEGIYSMDGDVCPLPALVALKRELGFALVVDEAHSFGVLGRDGRGVDAHFGLAPDVVDAWTGSLSKAVPSVGGFVTGSRDLVDAVRHAGAPFVFSSALCPAAAGAALAGLDVIARDGARRERLGRAIARWRVGLRGLGLHAGAPGSPVLPVLLGEDEVAFEVAARLRAAGFLASPVVHPAVPKGTARLRLCATAAQDDAFIDAAFAALARALPAGRAPPTDDVPACDARPVALPRAS